MLFDRRAGSLTPLLEKRYHLNPLDQVDVRSVNLRDVLLLSDADHVVLPAHVQYSQESAQHELLAYLLIRVLVALLKDLAKTLFDD